MKCQIGGVLDGDRGDADPSLEIFWVTDGEDGL